MVDTRILGSAKQSECQRCHVAKFSHDKVPQESKSQASQGSLIPFLCYRFRRL